MAEDERDKRFSKLRAVPFFAAVDHRLYLDQNGRDVRFLSLTRAERRAMRKGGKRIGVEYNKIMKSTKRSGAGYEIDRILREFCIEYTNRYAESGLYNQPLSFNYIEPFLVIDLINESTAPYSRIRKENDHIFSIVDYFDFITAGECDILNISHLESMPEGVIFNFTPSGDINDFTFESFA